MVNHTVASIQNPIIIESTFSSHQSDPTQHIPSSPIIVEPEQSMHLVHEEGEQQDVEEVGLPTGLDNLVDVAAQL